MQTNIGVSYTHSSYSYTVSLLATWGESLVLKTLVLKKFSKHFMWWYVENVLMLKAAADTETVSVNTVHIVWNNFIIRIWFYQKQIVSWCIEIICLVLAHPTCPISCTLVNIHHTELVLITDVLIKSKICQLQKCVKAKSDIQEWLSWSAWW